jgi:hypothetical protein
MYVATGGALRRRLSVAALAAVVAVVAGCASTASPTVGSPGSPASRSAGHSAGRPGVTGSSSGSASPSGTGHTGTSGPSPGSSAGSSPSPGSSTGNSGSTSGSASALQAVRLASSQARSVRSLALTENMSLQGLPTGAFGPTTGGSVALTLAVTMRLKPTLLADLRLHMTFGSRSLTMREILTSSTLYLDLPGTQTATAGKPWMAVSRSDLSSGVGQSTLFSALQEGDPMAGTASPPGLAGLLGAAQSVRVTGDQVIDGVPATEYSGKIAFHAFLAALAASERQSLASAPASLRTAGLPFKIWIDRSHRVRKLTLQLTYSGVSMAMPVNVTAINGPVHVSAPPPSQVSS